jgi:hypothetical protein
MRKITIEIKWGIIFFGATLLWMIFEKAVGLHSTHISKHAIYTNFYAIIAILLYVLALRDKRDKFYQGIMSWKQGFLSGVIVSLIVTVLSPIGQVITHKIITPHYFSNIISHSVDMGKMTQEAAEAYFSMNSYIIQSLLGALVMGIATSAIVAIFVRKKRTATE